MAKARKSKLVAGILAIFGGWAGIHRFYLGDTQVGIAYIAIMILTASVAFPVTTVMGFVEALRFLTMGQSEFDRKYNKHLTPGYQRDYSSRGSKKRTAKPQPTNYKKRENPYKKNGFKKYAESDIEGAIEDLQEGLKIDSRDSSIYFKLACAYSLMEKPDTSLSYLNQAIEHGYKDFNTINSIDDLAYLRISPVYRAYKAQGYSSKAQLSAPKQDLLQDDLLLAQLKKLSELRSRGLLSDTDYQKEKIKLKTRNS